METLAYVTGVVGVSTLGISTLPQVWRAWKKGVAGISYPAMVIALTVDTAWFTWDIFNQVPAAAIADGTNVLASIAVLYLITKRTNINPAKTILFYMALTVALIASAIMTPLAPGILAFALAVISRTFSFVKIIRSSNTNGVSTAAWLIVGTSLMVWAAHGYAISNTFLTVTSATLGIYSLTIAAFIITKRQKQARQNKLS